MRKTWLLFAASALLLLLLATGMAQSPATKFIVDPGPVVFDTDPNHSGAPSMVTGSVMLKRSPDGVGPDTSTYKLGGGCLAYLPSPVEACSDQSPCSSGYCGDTTSGTKACWRQPEPPSCARRPDLNHSTPLEENVRLKFDNPTPKYPSGVSQRPVFWRVISCQNLVDKGCTQSNPSGKVYRFGPIKRID